MAEIRITKDNFQSEVAESSVPVLLDFWATWCGPCRMIAPHLEEIAREKGDALKIGKVNVDEEPELANAFGIESIPTLVLFRDGKAEKAMLGYNPKAIILQFLGEN